MAIFNELITDLMLLREASVELYTLDESTGLDIINERKSLLDYRMRSFKKKYKFKPDKPDSNQGTITDKQGKEYHVNLNAKATKSIISGEGSESSSIDLDKRFFKLKGSNKSERRDAYLQHEIGHQNLHNRNPDNKTVDPKNRSAEVFINGVRNTIRNNTKEKVDITSDESIKKFTKNNNEDTHKFRKDVYGDEVEEYTKTFKGSKDDKKRRDSDFKAAKKFEKPNNNHLTAEEFEADRFAANRTSEGALKRSIRDYYKQTRKSFDKRYNEKIKSGGNTSEENRKKDKKDQNVKSEEDYNQRVKALKDKDLRNAKTYK